MSLESNIATFVVVGKQILQKACEGAGADNSAQFALDAMESELQFI